MGFSAGQLELAKTMKELSWKGCRLGGGTSLVGVMMLMMQKEERRRRAQVRKRFFKAVLGRSWGLGGPFGVGQPKAPSPHGRTLALASLRLPGRTCRLQEQEE